MKRRDFFKTLLGTAAAVAVGPKVVELVSKLAPPSINPAWHTATYEAEFIIPSQEVIDALVRRTAWHWNEVALKNLMEGVRKIAI
jgi:hypothetical protein